MREVGRYGGTANMERRDTFCLHTDRTGIIDRTCVAVPRKRRPSTVRRPWLVMIIIAVLLAGTIPLLSSDRDVSQWRAHTVAQTIIPGFVLSYQHADGPGGFPCVMCLNWMPWHVGPIAWNDTKYGGSGAPPPGDNQYGFVGSYDDCPHCIVYSGPACIQMIYGYRSGGPLVPQDMIYDDCELDVGAGEIQSNGVCERHGYGILDGTAGSPSEIQTAFKNWIGPMYQHNQWDLTALTASTLASYITALYPVIWDDHSGWPSNMDPTWPIPPENIMQGHYKVVAGYDDQGTPSTSDDLVLIYDPWPGYNDMSAVNPTPLPPGATPGPGGAATPDPYWLPIGTVLSDSGDLFFVEFAAIPEFPSLLVPAFGIAIITLVAIRTRAARRES